MMEGVVMDNTKCAALLAAVDTGSLTAAAVALGYTQPGITRIIHSLEREIGFTLLTRSPKGVELTENGKEMLPIFREMLRIHKNADEMSSAIRGILKGVLTVGSYFSVASMILPNIFRQFSKDYPDVQIKLREGGNQELATWLTEKSVDCIFATKPSSETEYTWLPITEDELVVWLPKNHPRAVDSEFPIEALNGESFIITRPNEDTDIDRLLQKYAVSPKIRLSTVDAFTTYCMVEAGMGISLNQRLIFQRWQGNVAAIPFKPRQFISLGIAVPSIRDTSPATKKFIEYVQQFHGIF